MGLIHSRSSLWSAWPESSSRLAISARTRMGSPKMRTSGHFSTSLRPSVSCAMKPVTSTVLRGSSMLLRRWWRMRPCSHIPEAEMTTNGPWRSLSVLDSAASRMYCRRWKPNGSSPLVRYWRVFGVEALGVIAMHLGHVEGQRAIHEEGDVGNALLVEELVEQQDELLGASHGKGGPR